MTTGREIEIYLESLCLSCGTRLSPIKTSAFVNPRFRRRRPVLRHLTSASPIQNSPAMSNPRMGLMRRMMIEPNVTTSDWVRRLRAESDLRDQERAARTAT